MSIWDRDRIPAARRFALGLWLPRRKLASRGYVPSGRERQKLAGKRPFWLVLGEATIAASQTAELRMVVQSDFTITTMMLSNTVGGTAANPGSRLQLFDASPQPGRGKRFSITGVNDSNFAGSARDPYILRRPYTVRAGHTLIARVLNLQAAQNKVQLVLHGVLDE